MSLTSTLTSCQRRRSTNGPPKEIIWSLPSALSYDNDMASSSASITVTARSLRDADIRPDPSPPPMPTLPLELLLLVAQHLVPPLRKTHSLCPALNGDEDDPHAETSNANFLAVSRLSSLNSSLRRLLAPLLWQDVLIHRPDRLGKLRSLMDYYQRLASSFSEVGRMTYPLPMVKRLRVVMPDRYLSLDQEILRHLIRSGMNPSNNLRSIQWDAEVMPGPWIWKCIGSQEKKAGLDEMLIQRKEQTLTREQIREIAYSEGAEGLYNPRDRRVKMKDAALEQRMRALSVSPTRRSRSSSRSRTGTDDEEHDDSPNDGRPRCSSPAPPGLEALDVHCRVFYSGHGDWARVRSLRHLRLTSYDSYLLPSHLPTLLLSLHQPLRSISLSTSKTSLLHDLDLIHRGCFSRLEELDVFPVTPEFPLCEGIKSAGRNRLRKLRLILDISGSFSNFDNLFKGLMSSASLTSANDGQEVGEANEDDYDSSANPTFPHLESLYLDPFPQENTAPSFPRFLKEACPKLKWLNGRRVDGMHVAGREGGGEVWAFDPDNRSGAFFY